MKKNPSLDNSSLEPMDDLDYLAEGGRQKIVFTQNEIENLNSSIRNSVKLPPPSFGIILFFIAVMVTATLVFLLNTPKISIANTYTPNKFSVTDSAQAAQSLEINFKEPEVPSGAFRYKNEHFLLVKQEIPNKIISENREMAENIEPMQIQSIINDSGSTIVNVSEFKTPVYDIMGYKISNYHRYYFKPKKNMLEYEDGKTGSNNSEEWKEPEHTTNAVNVLQDALSAMHAGKYPEALQQFELLLELNSQDENAIFYSGMCCFFNKKYSTAIDFFIKTESNSNVVFQEEAKFYRAMSLQHSGNTAMAKTLFTEIAKEKNFYASRASEFLK